MGEVKHQPFADDGAVYCGYATEAGVFDGCGEAWPCSAVRKRSEPMTDAHLNEIRSRMRGPFAMKSSDRWGVQATIDRLDLVAEVDRLRGDPDYREEWA